MCVCVAVNHLPPPPPPQNGRHGALDLKRPVSRLGTRVSPCCMLLCTHQRCARHEVYIDFNARIGFREQEDDPWGVVIPIPKNGNLSSCTIGGNSVVGDIVGKVVARVIQGKALEIGREITTRFTVWI